MPPMRTSGRTADPAVRAERMRVIPMRRPGEVEEVAYAILFLAFDESSYITGSEIHVDGGAIAIRPASWQGARRQQAQSSVSFQFFSWSS